MTLKITSWATTLCSFMWCSWDSNRGLPSEHVASDSSTDMVNMHFSGGQSRIDQCVWLLQKKVNSNKTCKSNFNREGKEHWLCIKFWPIVVHRWIQQKLFLLKIILPKENFWFNVDNFFKHSPLMVQKCTLASTTDPEDFEEEMTLMVTL